MARNHKNGVSEETRMRVFEYIKEQEEKMGISGFAKTSYINEKKSLLLSIHKRHSSIIIEKPFFSELIEAIQSEADIRGYNVLIKYCNRETNMNEFVENINEEQIQGVIILATELLREDLKAYEGLKCKYVLLDAFFDGVDLDSVTIDNYNATLKAFEYAYKMGHRKIGYISCNVFIQNFEQRYDGYMKGRRRMGLDDTENVVFSLGSNVLDAYIDMTKILDELPDNFVMPTCFLVDLDYMAVGAMKAFAEHGYKVPEDVSVIGFDDINFGDVYGVPLTTIHLHQRTMGRTAVNLLVDQIRNPNPCTVHIEISTDLIERKSVKKIDK